MIEMQNLSFGYSGNDPLLADLSLTLQPGSFHFLTGPSGSGKTSFLRLCYAELLPTAGRMTAFGQDVRGLDRDGIAALRQCQPASMDLLLIDPPFAGELFFPALQAAARAVAQDGFIYLEAPAAWTDEQLVPLGLALHRHLKAGAVHAHLLRPQQNATDM